MKRSWADPYHAWLMAQMEGTAWAVSNNYFTTRTGKIVTQWPFSALDYGALLKTLGRASETARRRGTPAVSVSTRDVTDDAVLHDAEGEEPLRVPALVARRFEGGTMRVRALRATCAVALVAAAAECHIVELEGMDDDTIWPALDESAQYLVEHGLSTALEQ